MFRGWPRSKLEKMCHLVRRKVYKPGEVIVRQDDRTDDVYFVIEGRCEVIHTTPIQLSLPFPHIASSLTRLYSPLIVHRSKVGHDLDVLSFPVWCAGVQGGDADDAQPMAQDSRGVGGEGGPI